MNDGFKPLYENVIQSTRKRISGGAPYFLFTGAIHERKNISNMLRAYDLFRTTNAERIKLVLAGNKKWWSAQMEETLNAMAHKDDVIFTGRVSDEELHLLTGSALAMVYVSFFEGFGIPVLEAMKCNVTVVASNASALPEICGDAALLVDPHLVSDIASALSKAANDVPLRKSLIEKGRQRCENFSWEKTAGLLWNSVEKAMI